MQSCSLVVVVYGIKHWRVTSLTPYAVPVLPPTPVPQPLMTHKEDVLSITLASLYDADPSVRAAGTHAVVAILKIKRVLKRDEVG